MSGPAENPPDRLGPRALVDALGGWRSGPESTLQERLVAAMDRAIESGWLPAGVRLPAERAVAEAIGVSRSTVTAAFNQLKEAGRLEARHGSGTSVRGRATPGSDIIDLAEAGAGEPGILSHLDVSALLHSATLGAGREQHPRGLPLLRDAIAEAFTRNGLPTTPGDVLVTNGAQHALALCFAVLAAPGDPVLVETPSYPGAIELVRARDLRPATVTRRHGPMDLDEIESAIVSSGCRLAYLQTLVHNPTGVCARPADLDALADVLDRHDVTLVEDLVLADLRFSGEEVAPLAARRTGPSVAVGSVSKLGWAGLRIGWIRAAPQHLDAMSQVRRVDDLGSSVPAQVISVSVLQELPVLVESRRAALKRRSAAAMEALSELTDWRWDPPDGGLTLWVELPAPRARELVLASEARGVLVGSGLDAVFDPRAGDRHIRLCFDRPEPQIRAGVERLAASWRSLGPPTARVR